MTQKLIDCEMTDEDALVVRIQMPTFRRVLPEARAHMVAARKEMLLALRSLIDAALERMPEETTPVKRTIKVE